MVTRQKGKESGRSLINMLIIVSMVGVIAMAGIRLVPIYSQHSTAMAVIKEVAALPGAAERSMSELWPDLERRFRINKVTQIGREDFTTTDQGGVRSLRVTYEVRTPMMGNVDAVVTFDRSFVLAR